MGLHRRHTHLIDAGAHALWEAVVIEGGGVGALLNRGVVHLHRWRMQPLAGPRHAACDKPSKPCDAPASPKLAGSSWSGSLLPPPLRPALVTHQAVNLVRGDPGTHGGVRLVQNAPARLAGCPDAFQLLGRAADDCGQDRGAPSGSSCSDGAGGAMPASPVLAAWRKGLGHWGRQDVMRGVVTRGEVGRAQVLTYPLLPRGLFFCRNARLGPVRLGDVGRHLHQRPRGRGGGGGWAAHCMHAAGTAGRWAAGVRAATWTPACKATASTSAATASPRGAG